MNAAVLVKKKIFKNYDSIDIFETGVRLWMGYVLISNSMVGLVTPLKDLGLPDHIYSILQGMWDTGFMMHAVKAIELIGGLMLVFNFFVPLALIALLPVVFNIYGVHIFLFDSYITKGLYMTLICGFLVYRHREVYKPLLRR
jgi:putative oxidoreductase